MNLGEAGPKEQVGKDLMGQTRDDELKRQHVEIQFSIAII